MEVRIANREDQGLHCWLGLYLQATSTRPGSAVGKCPTADLGVVSLIPAQSHTSVEIGYEIISTVILLLLIQEGLLSVIWLEFNITYSFTTQKELFGLYARSLPSGGLQTTNRQTSQRIRALRSAPLLFMYWKVSYINLLRAQFNFLANLSS